MEEGPAKTESPVKRGTRQSPRRAATRARVNVSYAEMKDPASDDDDVGDTSTGNVQEEIQESSSKEELVGQQPKKKRGRPRGSRSKTPSMITKKKDVPVSEPKGAARTAQRGRKQELARVKTEGEESSNQEDYNVEDEMEEEHKKDDVPVSQTKGRGRKRKLTPVKTEEEEEEESGNEKDTNKKEMEDEDGGSTLDETYVKDQPKKKRGRPTKKHDKNAGPEGDLTCPHCNKALGSQLALKYHVENFVCRPELKPGGSSKKRGRPTGETDRVEKASLEKALPEKASLEKALPEKASPGKARKKFRGSAADRTCPKCKRVFTSVLGKDYHCTNRVCEQTGAKAAPKIAFATLEPGMQFLTSFGVVEVVDDSRATPIAKVTKDPDRIKHWKQSRGKLERKRKENYTAVTVHSLARRKRLSQLYEKNEPPTQKKIWEAYFGREPQKGRLDPGVSPYPSNSTNPLEPEGSHPDRIVVCRLVPDKRKQLLCRVVGVGINREFFMAEEETTSDDDSFSGRYMRLFIRRRELSEQYIPETPRYRCQDCGKQFSSIDGTRYHCKAKSCLKLAKERKKEALERLVEINTRAERLIVGQEVIKTIKQSGGGQQVTKTIGQAVQAWPKQKSKPYLAYNKHMRKGERDAFYPQVWQSLGFKIVPRIRKTTRVSYFDRDNKNKTKRAPKPRNPGTFYLDSVEDISALDSGIDKMKNELDELNSQRLGAMYPEVFKMLRFRKPRAVVQPKESPPTPSPPEPAPYRPQPPPSQFAPTIIDVRVLAGEIDAGRYPSMKRNTSTAEKHADACYICKHSEGELYLCDFCTRVNHLECIRTRFIIKDPEPHDDFMCNKCIQNLLQRRRRAEKRRLVREGLSGDKQNVPAAQAPARVEINTVEPGTEFEYLRKQTETVDDIMHLLKDSQSRLKQLVETTKVNDLRRRHITDG